MEFNTDSFGVIRPPSESLPERGKLLKSASASESQPNLEHKSKLECLLSSKPIKKLKISDFAAIYDDDPEPFSFLCPRFEYKNKAQIIKEEQIEIAMADYRERSRNLSVFDAIRRPKISDKVGGGPVPIPIDEAVRLRLTPLCKLALDEYNADKDTHFVFANIVKTTWRPGAFYYITFQAQDSSNNNNADASLTTFQAYVVNQRPAPKVMSCAIKA